MGAFRSASNQLTLTLFRGHILKEILSLLKVTSTEVTEDPETPHKLIPSTLDPALRMIIVRVSDVSTYMQYDAVDPGVAGRNMLVEYGMAGLHASIDLNTVHCHISVAVLRGFDYINTVRQGMRLSVATKCLNTIREHSTKRGVHVDLTKLYGLMEPGPSAGLADTIIDLVSTGGTLCVNNLTEVEEIVQVSSRLAVSQAALKLKRDRLALILDAFEHASATGTRIGEAT